MLKEDQDPNVALEIAEALWRMGDEKGEDVLVAGTISRYASDQMLSLLALAEPRNTLVLDNVRGSFSSDYLEVRLVAARAAGILGTDEGYGIAMQGEKSADPRQRALAAMAFRHHRPIRCPTPTRQTAKRLRPRRAPSRRQRPHANRAKTLKSHRASRFRLRRARFD